MIYEVLIVQQFFDVHFASVRIVVHAFPRMRESASGEIRPTF
jgi:hypothetical protein